MYITRPKWCTACLKCKGDGIPAWSVARWNHCHHMILYDG